MIDHPKGTKIILNGDKMVLYQQSYPPVSCVDQEGNGCLDLITEQGDGNYFAGDVGDTLFMIHQLPSSVDEAYMIACPAVKCTTAINNPCSILPQLEIDTGWVDADTIHPRENWSSMAVNLSSWVDTLADSIVTRLSWTAYHKLDYVGVFSPINCESYPKLCDIDTFECVLVEANHSTQDSVTQQLLEVDSLYAELIGGEKIDLFLSAPEPRSAGKVRDFILITTGYYEVIGGPQTAERLHKVPRIFLLSQSCPNPFVSETSIEYGVPKKTEVAIAVYDVSGRLLKTLVDRIVDPGYHKVTWRGEDSRGRTLPSGVYFIKMESEGYKSTRKVVLMR